MELKTYNKPIKGDAQKSRALYLKRYKTVKEKTGVL